MTTINTTLPGGVAQTLDRLNAPGTPQKSAAAQLGSADFLRLMTAQLSNQDPLEPQSNEQMLAQLAQFSSLESSIEGNSTLDDIAAKLDALITAQNAAAEAAMQAAEAASAAAEAATNAAANAAS
ncbi:flagellar biosynthesis protein FlgD [Erythrobacter sp. SCSIO 43205]|uniref:flagellar hook assembly protein FlgD n=1 Tax=Erythrobacter sp. SCSIO 43205 TaxID=2779361 RepID=UPI001CA90F92|nr:flagellar hook capping FlgD N-terminal domain-containing protein [Erythrobacter sp. SCSIO 43205]UAB78723.1 flagellar biosynthesis protein FlgD [Erythrobacter sp. SCSIO 43205]